MNELSLIVFQILDFNTFYFMEDLPENHVSTWWALPL